MTTVKFDKSVKYKGVRYAAHEVFGVDENDVAQLREAGATIISTQKEVVETPEVHENKSDNDVAQLKEELLGFTAPKLIKFAQERGIDLRGKTRKADIYNIIIASIN